MNLRVLHLAPHRGWSSREVEWLSLARVKENRATRDAVQAKQSLRENQVACRAVKEAAGRRSKENRWSCS